ncbi:hypothetical protein BKA81DRAFT_375608 [Phyllosticta paracitricarpa]|uniref:FAD/NAD(P)-binding domain-containing protein n=1 Tax=Phyllosticta paracitricarpa TaxID=2016321 RepID=A0ABR1N9L5_9PEZI
MTAISSDPVDSHVAVRGTAANGDKANGHAKVPGAGAKAAKACEPGDTSGQEPHRVLVVGGAYAGVAAVLTLLDGADGKLATGEPPLPRLRKRIQVTLIDERDGFFHAVGTPLAHVAQESVSALWLRYQSISRLQRDDVKIRHGRVLSVHPENLCVTFADLDDDGKYATLEYDFLILASGLARQWPAIPKANTYDEYVQDALNHISSIRSAACKTVAIIGGGAVGIEFASEIKQFHPHNRVVLIHSRDKLLSNEPLPELFQAQAEKLLVGEGVEVVLNQRANVVATDGVSIIALADGRKIEAGHVFYATSGYKPNTQLLPREAVDEEGYVVVDQHMNLTSPIANARRHYACGDICRWSGIKRAGPAMVMGRVAATNVFHQLLHSEHLEHNEPWEVVADPDSVDHFDPASLKMRSSPAVYPQVPPTMALAVGKQAIMYQPHVGVVWGSDQCAEVFGNDLGWTNSLRYLGLLN